MGTLNLVAPTDLNNRSVSDPLAMYKISDQDATADPTYYGFIAHDGSYYIQKWNQTANTFRYYAGAGDYAAKWAARVSLPYDYFDLIF